MEGIIYLLTNQAMPNFVLIEIAATTQEMESDIKRFYNESSIPMPFELVYAGIIADYKVIYEFLKVSLSNYRINPERKFFTCSLNQINNIISLKEVRNITQTYKDGANDELLLPQSNINQTKTSSASPYVTTPNYQTKGYQNTTSFQPPPKTSNYQSENNANSISTKPTVTTLTDDFKKDFKAPETSNVQNFVDFRRLNIPINSIIICEKTQERTLVKSNFVIEFRGQNTTLYNATRLAIGEEFDGKKSILSYWSFNNKTIG